MNTMEKQIATPGAATFDVDAMLRTLERIELDVAKLREQIADARGTARPAAGVQSVREFAFCGMWKDREDMRGLTSSEWLARLRAQHWRRFAHG